MVKKGDHAVCAKTFLEAFNPLITIKIEQPSYLRQQTTETKQT